MDMQKALSTESAFLFAFIEDNVGKTIFLGFTAQFVNSLYRVFLYFVNLVMMGLTDFQLFVIGEQAADGFRRP